MMLNIKPSKKSIYLDYAATTPVDPAVLKVMQPYFSKSYGNPSSLYKQGRDAKAAIDGARRTIAQTIGARPQEIIFTAGGTESCNLAILGLARNNAEPNAEKRRKRHIITSAIEHHAVLHPIEALKAEGYDITVLDVDAEGLVNPDDVKRAVRKETVLVSIMYANNEIGSIEPIAEIGKVLTRINIDRSRQGLPAVVFHTDACQAAGSLNLDVNRLGVDLMSVNGSKIYGPKQTGFLYVRTGTNLNPYIYGGGQERNLRSGTENVPGVVGLARALELAQDEKFRNKEIEKFEKLQRYLVSKLEMIDGVSLNGPRPGKDRLVNNTNVLVDGVEGETLMLYLDSYGIAVSTGSACTTGMADPSHVLLSIGRSSAQAKSSIRLTLGRSTTRQELDYVAKVLSGLIPALREIIHF